MPVNSERPEYCENLSRWVMIRDVVNSDVKKYIKAIDKTDPKRNDRYKDDAQFTNFTLRTKAGLLGAVFRKDVVVELPEGISYLQDDATGFHMPLGKLAQECVGEVLMTGRYGLLVDYPATESGLTAKEVADQDLKARIYRYAAENIINWQTKIENGVPRLSLVVLKELFNELGEDGFEWNEVTKYRVLRLMDRMYVQAVYNAELELESVYTPTDFSGRPWDYIPFMFIGSEDNDSEVDFSPLYDLAKLNLGHLRNSADYEESIHIVGQPTLFIATDMTSEQFKAANPKGVLMGSRRMHNLGMGGKAERLQPEPNQLADVAMKRKEEQAVMIGARLIVPQADRETATAARMRHSGETSILSTIAHNVESALVKCCEYAMKFMTAKPTDGINVHLNDQYFDQNIDPNLLMAQLQLFQQEIIAKDDIRQHLKLSGILDEARTSEEIEGDLRVDPPKNDAKIPGSPIDKA